MFCSIGMVYKKCKCGKRINQVTLYESLSGKFSGRGGRVWPKLLNEP